MKSTEHHLSSWRKSNHGLGTLTDVVVLVSGSELEAERERCEELELLGEAQRAICVLRPVALPAFETPHAVFTAGVAFVVHHEEDVALHPAGRLRLLVVRTEDVQIVVDVHGDGVIPVPEPRERRRRNVWSDFFTSYCLIRFYPRVSDILHHPHSCVSTT